MPSVHENHMHEGLISMVSLADLYRERFKCSKLY